MPKTIEFFVRETYGVRREYVKDPTTAAIIAGLTGQKTIDGRIRELIRDLTAGQVSFVQVLS